MSWRGVLFISTIFWVVGAAYLLKPQATFRFEHAPFGPDGDGLTEEGEKAYRRAGLAWIVGGFVVAVLGLTL
ncbi:hypothetical protein [Halegenticoccus tardaugens]|uniref:hypothetical protein n=1 Tax=Halegenticoccus tardaugens TaxID=2071624 RepID=UPI00100B6F1B|nr:hypothetical protein [Halegenticoccus tardaugens]